jgi:hypothetical protein
MRASDPRYGATRQLDPLLRRTLASERSDDCLRSLSIRNEVGLLIRKRPALDGRELRNTSVSDLPDLSLRLLSDERNDLRWNLDGRPRPARTDIPALGVVFTRRARIPDADAAAASALRSGGQDAGRGRGRDGVPRRVDSWERGSRHLSRSELHD